MTFYDFLKKFYRKKKPLPLGIQRKGRIAELVLRESLPEDCYELFDRDLTQLDRWFDGKVDSRLKRIWSHVQEFLCSNAQQFENVISSKLNKELRREVMQDCGISFSDGEEADLQCFAYAVTRQYQAIAQGNGEAENCMERIYRLKLEEKRKRINGEYIDGLYVDELYRAYGDKEGIGDFDATRCNASKFYSDDILTRKNDFFAADCYRRETVVMCDELFEKLKNETYDGVEASARKKHDNGYECMLSVMDKAVNLSLRKYDFDQLDDRFKIRKGVCHHLVNDRRLVWVRREDE